ncbi:hypothetical protein ScPMuIL_010475 [Solemya velum]
MSGWTLCAGGRYCRAKSHEHTKIEKKDHENREKNKDDRLPKEDKKDERTKDEKKDKTKDDRQYKMKEHREDKYYRDDFDRKERSQPPYKKMRDDSQKSIRERDNYWNSPRGREFVRSRGRSRGRGRGNGFGRGRGSYDNRFDNRNYDNRRYENRKYDNQPPRSNSWRGSFPRNNRLPNVGKWTDGSGEIAYHSEGEDVEIPKRLRDKNEESDVEVASEENETSGSVSDSSGDHVSEIRESSREKDAPKASKEPKAKPISQESRDNRPDRMMNRDYRSRGDGRNSGFVPRGEPTKRGRGVSSRRGNVAPGGRYSNPPPRGGNAGNVGFGRPYRDYREDERPRRDNKRQERAPPPPRFNRRGGLNERGRGTDRSRGRGRGRGVSAPPINSKTPQLTKQSSSDMGNEEWETASESSGISPTKEAKNEMRDKEKKDSSNRKSFSSQRPLNDRQNRKSKPSESRRTSSLDMSKPNKERSPNATKNGSATRNTSSKRPVNSSHKENVVRVYRVNDVVANDQNEINNAFNNVQNQKNKMSRKTDLSDVSRPLKQEKKKDALADIDINNIASVVVIDDQPEVTIDDPNFLYQNNEGFQEVKSKKTQKSLQKAAQEAELRKMNDQKKKEVICKVVARPKGVGSNTADRNRFNHKMKQLPPRLAKQREQREREKERNTFMPKIENWDNELANNIPPLSVSSAISVETKSAMNVSVIGQASPVQPRAVTHQTAAVTVLAPAPMPQVNAWTKPISFASVTGSVTVSAEQKLDKGDQHDSGIDVSDQPNSGGSSTRSSPSTENKLKTDKTFSDHKMAIDNGKNEIDKRFDSPKPQRDPKPIRTDKVSVKDTMNKQESIKAIKKPEISKEKPRSNGVIEKHDPIQLPPSFKEPIYGKGDDLDFTFDENLATDLAKYEEEKALLDLDNNNPLEEVNTVVSLSGPPITSLDLEPDTPNSPNANLNIASFKTVWEIPAMPTVFEQGMTSSVGLGASVNTMSDSVTSSVNTFPTFSDMDNVAMAEQTVSMSDTTNTLVMEPVLSLDDNLNNSSLGPVPSMSPSPKDNLVTFSSEATVSLGVGMGTIMETRSQLPEQTNVCKVKPQQLQYQPSSFSTIRSSSTGGMVTGMSAVPSPPIILPTNNTQFSTFQLGSSQLLAQEPRQFTQPSYGYSLSQPQPQPQPQLTQPTFSQPSLFLPTTPTQDLYQPSQLSAFPRNQPGYGQTAQQNTIMVSSATSSLMSTTIKPPTQTGYGTTIQKGLGPSSLQYGQSLSSTSLQPSQISFIQYDPGQLFGTNQILGSTQTAQNLNSSQIIGSQLVQSRPTAIQNVQSVQPSSSFYQQPQQSLQQTGFFATQQATSNLQGALQQAANASATPGHPFSLQAFGSQPTNLSLSLQPTGPSQNLGLTPQPTAKGSQFSLGAQQTSPQANQLGIGSQMKSPSQSMPPTNMGNTQLPASPNSKQYGFGQLQSRNTSHTQRFSSMGIQQFGAKFNLPIQQTGPVVRQQVMMGSLVRPNAPPPNPFPNPIQRPVVSNQVPRQQTPLQTQPQMPQQQQTQQQMHTKPVESLRAQQLAKQRQEVLAHAQNFLNPQNKPGLKQNSKADSPTEENNSGTTEQRQEDKSEKQ